MEKSEGGYLMEDRKSYIRGQDETAFRVRVPATGLGNADAKTTASSDQQINFFGEFETPAVRPRWPKAMYCVPSLTKTQDRVNTMDIDHDDWEECTNAGVRCDQTFVEQVQDGRRGPRAYMTPREGRIRRTGTGED